MAINTNRWNRIRYSFYAPVYDGVGALLNGMRKRSIALLGIQSGDKLLIDGAGTGLDLGYISESCEITATDITPSMVARIKKRAELLHLNVTALVMDAQKLEFADGSFDKIVLHLIVAVVPDPVQTLREAERVLKPGGSLVILDKFVHKHRKPSALRKAFNLFTNLMFSDITRSVEEIVSHTSLIIVEDMNGDPTGNFRIVKMVKPNS